MFNGNHNLRELVKKAGYSSLSQIVAEQTLFTHPDTVKITANKNIFRIIRNASKRGKLIEHIDGKKAMFCDNEGPNRAFRWGNGDFKYSDVQFNHIYSDSQNIEIYTSLANICVTPAFIAKLTDTDDEIKNLLKYRSYDLYGFYQDVIPEEPENYKSLNWKSFIPPITNLEDYFIKRMRRAKKTRSSISAREIGWYFSNYEPDGRLI